MKNIYLTIWFIIIAMALVAIWRFWVKMDNGSFNDIRQVRIGEKIFLTEVADTDISRMRGLSGRDNLNEEQAMLFLFDNSSFHSFWMKDMKFPIDMIWINNDRVVGVSENVPVPVNSGDPLPAYYPPEPIDKVLEVRAGSVRKFHIQVGDKVFITQ